jgi:TolB-like protein
LRCRSAQADEREQETCCFEGCQFDLTGRVFVSADKQEVPLTRSEAELLTAFVRNSRRVLSRDQLRRKVKGLGADSYDRSVDMLVARLWRKIEPKAKARFIVTVSGGGYKFIPPLERPQSLLSASALAPAIPRPDKPSLAVLPFENMSSDPEQEFLADGMAEDIITALSRVNSLFVIARNTTFTFKGQAIDAKQVGRELGVRYVLEGSVRKIGSRIRVTAQLIDADTAHHIWAEKYDCEFNDIFEIQDEITRAVVASVHLQVELFEGETAGREQLNTWSLLKKAWRRLLDLDIPALEEARELAEEALRKDPKSARAHAVLSVAVEHLVEMGGGPNVARERARARDLAVKAIEINEREEYSHFALGNAYTALGESDQAIAAYRRALKLNPNYAVVYGVLGTALAYAGQPEESIAATLVAIRSNPRDPSIFFRYSGLAMAYYILEDFNEAIGWATKIYRPKKGMASSTFAADRKPGTSWQAERCPRSGMRLPPPLSQRVSA